MTASRIRFDEFIKSTYSMDTANCVEVMAREVDAAKLQTGCHVEAAHDGEGGMWIRQSDKPDGPYHHYTASEWEAFIAGAKDGEFDL